MQIEVFNDLNDTRLRDAWLSLESTSIFPQHQWHWCAGWWRTFGNGRLPYVLVVRDTVGVPIAIAPFMIDELTGVRYLRTMPENFGDFFEVVTSSNADPSRVLDVLFAHLKSFSRWRAVVLGNIRSSSALNEFISGAAPEGAFRVVVKNVVTDLPCTTFDEYLSLLKHKHRYKFKKRLEKFESSFKISASLSFDRQDYLDSFDRIFEIQSMRWNNGRPKRTSDYISLVRETHGRCFEMGQMCLLRVFAGEKLAAYRLGFVHQGVFYDWNTSYDIEFEDFSPGSLSIAYLMRELLSIGVSRVDFMAGFYEYKLSYSPSPVIHELRMFCLDDRSFLGRFIAWYFLKGRERLKSLRDRFLFSAKRK